MLAASIRFNPTTPFYLTFALYKSQYYQTIKFIIKQIKKEKEKQFHISSLRLKLFTLSLCYYRSAQNLHSLSLSSRTNTPHFISLDRGIRVRVAPVDLAERSIGFPQLRNLLQKMVSRYASVLRIDFGACGLGIRSGISSEFWLISCFRYALGMVDSAFRLLEFYVGFVICFDWCGLFEIWSCCYQLLTLLFF